MPALDDPFLHFLSSISGQTIAFLAGVGGLDDALTSLAFHALCERHDITCRPLSEPEGADDGLVVIGSLAVALTERARLKGRRIVVLPGSLSRFEDLGDVFDDSATVFWRDRPSLRRAELQGSPPRQAIHCHDLTIHIDANSLVSASGGGSGTLNIDVDGRSAASSGDRIDVYLDGRSDRWTSPDVCRDAVQKIAGLVARCAEISTDSPGLAILAAQMGKAVRLSGKDRSVRAVFDDTIARLYPGVALVLDPGPFAFDRDGGETAPRETASDSPDVSETPGAEIPRLKGLLAAARREAQFTAQERDHLVGLAADLRDRLDAGTVAVARSYLEDKRRAEDAERQTAERLADMERRAAEQLQASTDAAAAASHRADARSQEADEAFARLSQAASAAEMSRQQAEAAAEMFRQQAEAAAEMSRQQVEAAAEMSRQQAEAAAEMARQQAEAAAREAALQRRVAELDAAFAARTRQALVLQSTLDERDARSFAAEGRIDQMRALIDRRTMTADEALRDAETLRRRLDAVLSSASWRASRPLRGVSRALRRLTVSNDGARRG